MPPWLRRYLSALVVVLLTTLGTGIAYLAYGLVKEALTPRSPQSWKITRFDAAANVDQGGTARVTLDFDFDFAGDPGHGPYLTLPRRQLMTNDPDHWRLIDVTDVQASSPSGASPHLQVTANDDAVLIRVGEDSRTWTGVQSYLITYSIRGLIAPAQAQSGLDEVNWNVIGPEWAVTMRNVSVRITGPAAVTKAACFRGVSYNISCPAAAEGATATSTSDYLGKTEALQAVAGFPAGTFTGADARLTNRYWPGNMYAFTPVTAATTGLATLVGLSGLWWYLRRRGDRAYVGMPPGQRPTAGSVGTHTRSRVRPSTVAFTPPAGVRPGELGVLLDAGADGRDVSATLVDLAVRGHLTIEPLENKGQYSFTRAAVPDDVLPYEEALLARLFAGAHSVTSLELKKRPDARLLVDTQADLRARVTRDRRWFSGDLSTVQNRAVAAGVALIVLGVGLGLVLGYSYGFGLVLAAPLITGLAVLLSVRRFSARTPEGSVVLAQALGFKAYLTTAEAGQIRFEEGSDVFSRYLPYAIVYGVTAHWVRVFEELAAEGRYSFGDVAWYVGGPGQLGADMMQFASAFHSALVIPTAGTSGGSGFRGGGGFGGGGGGGW